MASIIVKNKKGNRYYYIVESARVNGKPRIVNQIYLGTAEKIKEKLYSKKRVKPIEIVKKEYGLSFALVEIAKKIDLVSIVNSVCPKGKRILSLGQLLLVLSINRLWAPLAKRHISYWFQNTALSSLLKCSSQPLSGQNIYSAFDGLKASQIQKIHRMISKKVISAYGISAESLFYDATNFYTYMDFKTPSRLAQKGYSKENKKNLRIINLALLISQGEQIPLFHEAYPGNKNDVSNFSHIVHRVNSVIKTSGFTRKDITLIFDRGNNSEDNLKLIHRSKLQFVGGLPKSMVPDLYDTPLKNFEDYKERKLYRCQQKVYGKKYTTVISYHHRFYAKQIATFYKGLQAFENAILRIGSKSKRSAITYKKAVEMVAQQKALFPRFASLLDIQVRGLSYNKSLIEYTVDQEAIEERKKTFGKFILFTNRDDWSSSQIIDAYFGKDEIEKQFELIKNKELIRTRPFFHWTDQQIRAHIFVCVLSLTLWNLFKLELKRSGIKVENRLAAQMLKDIHQCHLLYSLKAKPQLKLSHMNEVQQSLIKYFENLL